MRVMPRNNASVSGSAELLALAVSVAGLLMAVCDHMPETTAWWARRIYGQAQVSAAPAIEQRMPSLNAVRTQSDRGHARGRGYADERDDAYGPGTSWQYDCACQR